MSVVVKISKTYRRPIRTYSNLFASGPSEKQNLAYLMGGCLLYFISSWPFQARKAFEDQIPLEGLISGTLISALFVAPLGFYLISIVFHLLAKALGSKISGVEIRLILFWAILAIAPLMRGSPEIENKYRKRISPSVSASISPLPSISAIS